MGGASDPNKFSATPTSKINILEAYDQDDESIPEHLRRGGEHGRREKMKQRFKEREIRDIVDRKLSYFNFYVCVSMQCT